MRTPTPHAELYAHHAASLRGERPPMFEDEPQCGWFKMRMIKGGPWVPVEIWIDQHIDPVTEELSAPEQMLCEVGGEASPLSRAWPRCSNKPISCEAYYALVHDEGLTETLQATHVAVDLTEKAMRP